MHPHTIISLLPSLALAGALPRTSSSSSCKAFPGSPSWPSTDLWTQLNETVAGCLLHPALPGGVCHKGQPNYDAEQCEAVGADGEVGKGLWSSYDWHAADPLSVEWDNWANWTCLPRTDVPCSRAGYPAYVVNASSAEHVAAAVNFARENNVRLNVKSSGHDFLGRSNAPGSLSIWVHHLNSLAFHKGSFTLTEDKKDGCHTVIEGDAITVGGGTAMYDIYKFADQHGAAVVGGGAKSVSVGGYITGGGHSILSPTYSLAADNVLEIEVVTPAGEILVANEKQNKDLFWALRGGGGSTFGVLTSITLQAHPTPKIESTNAIFAIPSNSTQTRSFLGWLLGSIPSMMDAGLAGYDYFSATDVVPVPYPGLPPNLAGMSGSLVLVDREPGALQAELDRLSETVKARFAGAAGVMAEPVKTYGTFLEWFDENFDAGTCGASAVLKSRLIDESALTEDPEAIVDALMSASAPTGGMSIFLLGGKEVNEAKPRGGSNAVNPGWRKAFVHSLTASGFAPFNRTAEREAVAKLDAAWEPLTELTPGLGAYINEASAFEKDAPLTFWGDNYERLLAIKREVDPHDVFWCSPCVGNNRWKQSENGQLCRVGS